MPLPLLIVGASGRAAAGSAGRAGFAPEVFDLFADRDLVARFPARPIARDAYPDTLPDRLATAAALVPWLYTGAIENHPAIVDRIARERPLLGIAGGPLRAVRDPARWTRLLDGAGLAVAPILGAGDTPPRSGRWLCKPARSAAGHGVRPWMIGEGPIPKGCYLQAFVTGPTLGATFLGAGRSATLVAVTRTILGLNSDGFPFAYRGSLGPIGPAPGVGAAIAQVGDVLADAFGLTGLFGVDLILGPDGPVPVEINPRYTASVEVIERATGRHLLAEHARAFGVEPGPSGALATSAQVVAKRILYADRALAAPEGWPWGDPAHPWPTVADLPTPGTSIGVGEPVLTVFAGGPTPRAAALAMAARVALWRRRVAAWERPAPVRSGS